MGRHRGGDPDGFAVAVDRHHELAGMQMQRRSARARRMAVDRVAYHRPPHRGAMHAQLVGSAGQRLEREPSETGRAPQHRPGGRGWLPLRVGLHPPAAGRILASKRQIDPALRLRQAAFHHRPIGLADGARLEQPPELRQRLAMAAERKAAGGIAVEPVRQRRRPRETEAQRIEIILQALAAFGPPMHRHAGRLVDDQHQGIAVKEPSHHLFRCHAQFANTAARALSLPFGAKPVTDPSTTKQSWWQRLSGGLKRTSSGISGSISDLICKRKLDSAIIEEIEEVLIRADLGVDLAGRIAAAIGEGRYDKAITEAEVKAVLAAEVERVMLPVAKPLQIGQARPFTVLVVGVNGSGKTTTVGKLAARYRGERKSVMLVAGDTFRAAAIDQ